MSVSVAWGWARRAGLLAGPLALVACGARGRPETAPAGGGCQPVAATALAGVSWDSLAGEWHLTLVATRGPMAGRVADGPVRLRAQEASLRHMDRPPPVMVSVPIIGATDLAVEDVFAVRMGDLRSADPQRPGVSLWVSRGADGGVSAVMRIGQEEIGSHRQPFDAGYTVLYLRRASATAFYGGWASGTPDEVANGHFCAVRAVR